MKSPIPLLAPSRQLPAFAHDHARFGCVQLEAGSLMCDNARRPEVSVMNQITRILVGVFALASVVTVAAAPQSSKKPPKGFTSLFNGKDLSGWRGRQPNYNPVEEAKLSPDDHKAKQTEWDGQRDAHWKVDTAKQEIVSDGQSPHLATAKDYGDFEFYVDWLMVNHNGDSGIYLRGYPQVQVWDPDNPREVKNGAPKGSGALWNNNADNPGKWPLVKADNPVGEWNTFHIKMVGPRVWVWLNDKLTVDGQVLDNYFDRAQPVVARGPIELQTHGSEIRFRNIFIREIPEAEAKKTLSQAPAK
jgi:3-keto-disaccharide hydrolase